MPEPYLKITWQDHYTPLEFVMIFKLKEALCYRLFSKIQKSVTLNHGVVCGGDTAGLVRETTIAIRPRDLMTREKPAKSGDSLRVNDEIVSQEVRLVSATGEALGVVPLSQARQLASEAELDLVEISPKSDPPVCKIMNYGKYRYELQKKKNEAKKKQKVVELKEIQIRPGIDQHDFDVKMRAAEKFLRGGDKVKVTMRFRGREINHQSLGLDVLNRVIEGLSEISKVDSHPKLDGKQYLMVLAPQIKG